MKPLGVRGFSLSTPDPLRQMGKLRLRIMIASALICGRSRMHSQYCNPPSRVSPIFHPENGCVQKAMEQE